MWMGRVGAPVRMLVFMPNTSPRLPPLRGRLGGGCDEFHCCYELHSCDELGVRHGAGAWPGQCASTLRWSSSSLAAAITLTPIRILCGTRSARTSRFTPSDEHRMSRPGMNIECGVFVFSWLQRIPQPACPARCRVCAAPAWTTCRSAARSLSGSALRR